MRRTLAGFALLQLLTCGVLVALEVRGRAVDETGAAVVGAWVELHRVLPRHARSLQILAGGMHPDPVARARTSETGQYRLAVPKAGMWQIDVLGERMIPVRRRLLPLLESVDLPQAVLSRDAGVEVRTVDADGLPVAGAQVWVRALSGGAEELGRPNRDWEERGWFGLTDKDGRVVLSRGVGETIEVFAYASGFMPSEAKRARGGPATVHLERGRPVTLRFTTPSGELAAQAVILVGGRQWTSAMTDDKGRTQIYFRPDEPLAFGLITTEGQYETGNLQAAAEDLAQDPDQEEEMKLPPPVVLEGRVIEAEELEPAVDAWVWSASDPGNAIRADGRGRYRLVQGSGRRWRIGAAKVGYQVAWDLARREVETLRVPTLALVRSGAAEGWVSDTQGMGVVGAQVQALPTEGSGSLGRREPSRSWTGADGRFALSGLSVAEQYELLVEAEGFASTRRVIRLPEEDRIEIVLAPGRTLTGRLVGDAGEPLNGGHIEVMPVDTNRLQIWYDPYSDGLVGSATSDADGRFQVENLPDQTLGLVAAKEGFAVTRVSVPASAAADQVVDLGDLVLSPGASLEGVVRDTDGKAIAEARVEVQRVSVAADSPHMMTWIEAGEESLTTDDDGRFLVENLASDERVSFTVQHPGFMTYTSNDIEPGSGEPTIVVLERAARVSGRVENEHGDRVEGLTVEVSAASPASGRPSGRFPVRFPRERVRSGEDGSFALAEVPPGRVVLSAGGSGYIASEQVELIVAVGEERSDVILRVRRGVDLSGTVSDASGRPVAGAGIMVWQEGGLLPGSGLHSMSRAGRSDAEGRYAVEGLDPEQQGLVLRVRHGDYPSQAHALHLEQGSNRLDLVLDAGASVAGAVLNEAGEPVAGAKVGLRREQGRFSPNRHLATSQADGTFEITGVAAGTHRLFASKEGYAETTAAELVEVAADQDVRGLVVYLSRGGTIGGRILGLEPGELAQVRVFATDGHSQNVMGLVRPSGEYTVAHVGFEEGSVEASHDSRGQSVGESFDLDTAGGETWVDLEFAQRGSVLEGVVLFDGEPWQGVRVRARGDMDSHGDSSTDDSGHFQIHGLRDGSYELSLYGYGTITHSQTIQVVGNTEVTIEITGVRISGSVLDASTWEGIAGALVAARGETGSPGFSTAQTATLQSGHFELVLPANHSVTLQARADGFAQGSVSLDTGPGGEIAGIELGLERAADFELEVRLDSGLRPNPVSVGIVDGAGAAVFTDLLFSTVEGALRLRSVPPGEWLLLVAARGGATVSVPILVPGPPVVVTLPPEARISVDLGSVAKEIGFGRLRLLTQSGEPFRIPVGNQILTEWSVMGSRAILPSVPAGDWVIELVDEAGQVWRQSVTTVAGQTSQVTIQ